jgi:superfamily I DNA and/or RNA helicase
MLAGIRDYSEYIPLEKDLFDLIIIDEASQVSIAQSLPALIRGKKIIIL